MKKTVLIIIVAVLLILGCARKFDFGELKGNVYRNDYFGLIFSIPSGWEATMPIKQIQKKAYEQYMPVNDVQGAHLLRLMHTQKVIGSDQKNSQVILIMCINLKKTPGISSVDEYLQKTKEDKENSNYMEHTFAFNTEMIDNLEFKSLIIDDNTEHLVHRFDDFLLIFKLSYDNRYPTHREYTEREMILQTVKNIDFMDK